MSRYKVKRLEQGNFSWPTASEPDQTVINLTHQALQLILDGVQLRDGSLTDKFADATQTLLVTFTDNLSLSTVSEAESAL